MHIQVTTRQQDAIIEALRLLQVEMTNWSRDADGHRINYAGERIDCDADITSAEIDALIENKINVRSSDATEVAAPLERFDQHHSAFAGRLTDLVAQLAACGVATVLQSAEGEGDEGFIEEMTCVDGDSTPIELPVALDQVLSDFLAEMIEHFASGYEDGNGGGCRATINVELRTLAVEVYYFERREIVAREHIFSVG